MARAVAAVLQCFRKSWEMRRQFLAAHILVALLAAAVISPIVAGFTRLAIALSGEPALADFDIARYLLTPLGFTCLIVVTSVALTSAVLGVAIMMSIELGDRRGEPIGFQSGLAFVLRRCPSIVALSGFLITASLLIFAPGLLAAALTAKHFLAIHDINYYLTSRPTEFLYAGAFIGAILAASAVILLDRVAAWSLTLPLLLFSDYPPMSTVSKSVKLTRGRRKRVLGRVLVWSLASLALGLTVGGIFHVAAGQVLQWAGANLRILVLLIIGLLVFGAIVGAIVTALTFGSLAVLLLEETEASGAPLIAASSAREARTLGSTGADHTLAFALAFAALLSAASGLLLLSSVKTTDRVQVIGHRGAAGSRPENTIVSFRKAIEDKADWIELDVQETADGEVVVVHDSDFMKLAGVDLKVWDATMPALAGIDIGTWFSPAYSRERVPTLRAVLEEAKGKARVLIELKYYGHDKRLEERVVGIVESAGMTENVAVMSLNAAAVQKMKALRPHWRVGLLVSTAVGDLTRLNVDFLAVNSRMATSNFIRGARKAGRDVYVWTVNDQLEMSRFISRGAVGLITDEPALARNVLASRADLATPERLLLQVADLFNLRLNRATYRDTSP